MLRMAPSSDCADRGQARYGWPLAHLANVPPPFEARVHRLYNPEKNSQFNTVPGLMGGILTMTLVMMTGLAMTRERERGTMENLLAMPVRPIEVMTGKIVLYVVIGLIQATIILLAAYFVFDVPFMGILLKGNDWADLWPIDLRCLKKHQVGKSHVLEASS